MRDLREMESLRVEGLKKSIGTFTLCADFSIGPKERAAIVGRSGSGKTSLLRVIAGLDVLRRQQDSGRIFLGAREITGLAPRKREIGFVFQEPALFPALNVLENVTFALNVRGVSRRERETVALPWLEKIGLKDHARANVSTLSGGEKQRVAFIRALIWKPKLILLDEPFSALDPALRDAMRRELVALHELWPVPMLFVTHDEADLAAVATVRLRLEVDEAMGLRRIGGGVG